VRRNLKQRRHLEFSPFTTDGVFIKEDISKQEKFEQQQRHLEFSLLTMSGVSKIVQNKKNRAATTTF
jgi:hypothetical protein